MFFPLAQLVQLCLYGITYFCTVLATEAVSSCSDLFAGGETELGHWSCRKTPDEAKPHEVVLCRGWMVGLGGILSNPSGYFSTVIHAQSSNMEQISRRRGCIFLVSHNLLLFVTIYSAIFLKHFLMVYFSAVLPMVVPIFNCQYDFLINLFATTFLRMNAENEGIKRGNVQKVFISSRLRHL